MDGLSDDTYVCFKTRSRHSGPEAGWIYFDRVKVCVRLDEFPAEIFWNLNVSYFELRSRMSARFRVSCMRTLMSVQGMGHMLSVLHLYRYKSLFRKRTRFFHGLPCATVESLTEQDNP